MSNIHKLATVSVLAIPLWASAQGIDHKELDELCPPNSKQSEKCIKLRKLNLVVQTQEIQRQMEIERQKAMLAVDSVERMLKRSLIESLRQDQIPAHLVDGMKELRLIFDAIDQVRAASDNDAWSFAILNFGLQVQLKADELEGAVNELSAIRGTTQP